MTIKEVIQLENQHSRTNDPATWHAMYRTLYVPKYFKETCMTKHDIDYMHAVFYILKDKHKRQIYLICFANRQHYINSGSGWTWYGTETDARKLYKNKLIPA